MAILAISCVSERSVYRKGAGDHFDLILTNTSVAANDLAPDKPVDERRHTAQLSP
jgi:hypothetical protein